ncbi:MAG TPA: thioesterase family protein [Flavobacteriaceae bacterium]|nr:thioesterase family protein [Flavobacteriaceae bacterium]
MYTKKFEIRWSDIDANRHLSNSAYVNYMSHTRMGFLIENGFGQQELVKHNLGPVVFHEHIYYFQELFAGNPVTVSLQLKGISEDGMFFEFLHNFYDPRGKNCARCEMLGSWIDMKTRKLTVLPEKFLKNLNTLERTDDFKILTKEDTRKHGVFPIDLSPPL